MNRITRVIFWTLFITMPMACLTYYLMTMGDPTFVLGFVAAILVGAAITAIVLAVVLVSVSRRAIRRRRASVVLSYLDQAIRSNLPLTRFLAAAQASEPRVTAARIAALRRQLEAGATVSDALHAAIREMSPRTLSLIVAGERAGQLPRALDRLAREDRSRQATDPAEETFYSIYPVMMTITLLFVVTMMTLFVMPKFERIFGDYHISLPAPTVLLLAISRSVSQGSWFFPVVLWISVWVILSTIRDRYWPARARNWGWLTGWFHRNRDYADICRVIADSLHGGLPLDSAIRTAGHLAIAGMLRFKLYQWADGIEQGLPAADAARRAGMPDLITGLTATGETAAAAETFRFLARYYHGRFSRLAQLFRAAAIPAMVFFFGIIIGFVALALFLPLVSLIDAASPYRVSL